MSFSVGIWAFFALLSTDVDAQAASRRVHRFRGGLTDIMRSL
jgi:hypothetical protein